MNCQNCQTKVDDDLIFCTNCGDRLFEPKIVAQTVFINDSTAQQTANERPAQTVLMSDSVATKTSLEQLPKSSSNFKWIALIFALVAIPASLFGVYLLTNSKEVAQNTNKPKTPAPTATRKPKTNQNSNANLSSEDADTENLNVNTNTNSSKSKDKIEIMNERIELDPDSHFAIPFEIEKDTAKIIGEVRVLEGEKINGFVYTQKAFDESFPDETYKIFSFEGTKFALTNQTLVKEKYVLVFVNDSDKSIVIQGNFSVE